MTILLFFTLSEIILEGYQSFTGQHSTGWAIAAKLSLLSTEYPSVLGGMVYRLTVYRPRVYWLMVYRLIVYRLISL